MDPSAISGSVDDTAQSVAVTVCAICGAAGLEEELAYCSKCEAAEHFYCMIIKRDNLPDNKWICEECVLSEQQGVSTPVIYGRGPENSEEIIKPKAAVPSARAPSNLLQVAPSPSTMKVDTNETLNKSASPVMQKIIDTSEDGAGDESAQTGLPLSEEENSEDVPDWSNLDSDLLGEIASRVPLMEDFMAFRGVCTTWRAVASKKKFKAIQPSIPLLVFPTPEDGREDLQRRDEVAFYSLLKMKVSMRTAIPELRGKDYIDVKYGWLLTTQAAAGAAALFNPLSGAEIKLPTAGENVRAKRAALSADPARTSNLILMVVWDLTSSLRVWRAGEESWTELSWTEEVKPQNDYFDVAYHNGKFYVFREDGPAGSSLWVWDPFGPDVSTVNFVMRIGNSLHTQRMVYLAESTSGELLYITHYKHEEHLLKIVVTRIDVESLRAERTSCIGEDAVFLGRNASVVVAGEVAKANCIYFAARDELDQWQMGVYHLRDRSAEYYHTAETYSDSRGLPLWFAPSS